MSTENWVPLTKEQVEKRFIEIINDYVKLELEYPLDPNMSLKDVKMFGSKDLKDIDAEALELLKSDYELDSIDILELVIQIEEEFGCVIDDKEVATLLRWEDLVGYITDSQDPTKIKKK
jgi:acyl carrier protein